ncbi:MAG: RNA polymerase subunit sigma-70 [Pirellula sp.]|nr:RNA polymerase subunit sigma-70 [Pirellula sp.]
MAPQDEAGTTAAVQQYLGELAGTRGDAPADSIIRALLARSVRRLQMLCSALLHQSYPRLTYPPLNCQADELLSAVVERLLKSLEKIQPATVRQFFALANQHIRWELNDLARRLDRNEPDVELLDSLAVAPSNSESGLSQNTRRMLKAIEDLPEIEREVFSLVRIQGMTHAEAAEITGVSLKTVQRRLNHAVLLLSEACADLQPDEKSSSEA